MKAYTLLKIAVVTSLVGGFVVACAPKDKKLSGTKPEGSPEISKDVVKANLKQAFGDSYNPEDAGNKELAGHLETAALQLKEGAAEGTHTVEFSAYFNDVKTPISATQAITFVDSTTSANENPVQFNLDKHDCGTGEEDKSISGLVEIFGACLDKECTKASILLTRKANEESSEKQEIALIFDRAADKKVFTLRWAPSSSGYDAKKLANYNTFEKTRDSQVDDGSFKLEKDAICSADASSEHENVETLKAALNEAQKASDDAKKIAEEKEQLATEAEAAAVAAKDAGDGAAADEAQKAADAARAEANTANADAETKAQAVISAQAALDAATSAR